MILDRVRNTLDRARAFTLEAVADFSDADARRGEEWRLNPAAWILSHLAFADLRLCLHFPFGVSTDEPALAELKERFGRGSTAPPPDGLPSLDQARHWLSMARARADALLDVVEEDDLEKPPANVLPTFPDLVTRVDVLLQCALHESQHAGQILWLRKLMGKPPVANYR